MTKTLQELRLEATEKGIAFDGRYGTKKLKKLISMACNDACHTDGFSAVQDGGQGILVGESDIITESDIFKIKNISPNKYEILSLIIKPLEVVELSKSQLNDVELMKRINRHIEIKKFKLVE